MDRLENPVRHYAWGSARDIPEFLGVPPDGTPQAELWMGAHPGAPSLVLRDGTRRPLPELIAADPEAELGPAVATRFGGRLPFLLKVLAAGEPLSLQVHPDKARAVARFADPRYAADYTDDNHKPELICALRDGFEALCGFRPVPATAALLDELAVPGQLADTIAGVASAGRRVSGGGGAWAGAGRAYARLAAAYPGDPGVLVALLLNHAVLAEGAALFVAAGVPHCYLGGFGAEVMASSDNVLRAGLTSKRVNVPELLEVLDFTPAPPRVLHAEPDGVQDTYPVPVPDFRLGRLRLGAAPVVLPGGTAQILLATAGTVRLDAPGGTGLELRRGQSAWIAARCAGVTAAGPGTLLRATAGM
jgi:mannose-6-phosphate isomerase